MALSYLMGLLGEKKMFLEIVLPTLALLVAAPMAILTPLIAFR